jgi:hypothetical protein
VVLLLTPGYLYQEYSVEVDLKYCDRDVAKGCSIFFRSKDGGVGGRPQPLLSTNHITCIVNQKLIIKEKCLSVSND